VFDFFKIRNITPPEGRVEGLFPSIWVGCFDGDKSWRHAAREINDFYEVADQIDDRQLYSRHEFDIKAWCAVCGCLQRMRFRWYYSHPTEGGSSQPAWSETPNCEGCLLNSRMRAVFSFLRVKNVHPRSDIFITEAVTDGFRQFKKHYPCAVGSEYFGVDFAPGKRYPVPSGKEVMHQDLTCLSFDDSKFDVIVSQEVFEHIPDYKAAFSECRRVLRKGGRLVFTIPFNHTAPETVIRARIANGGEVHFELPAIYHGNPVDVSGSLCFQDFGWDILESLREAGFSEVSANMYWGPWQGHFGNYFFVFDAVV